MRCRDGTRKCKASEACVVPQKAKPPLPNKRFYKCKTGYRQCPNRRCYPSALFRTGQAGDDARRLATTIRAQALARGFRTRRAQHKHKAAVRGQAVIRGFLAKSRARTRRAQQQAAVRAQAVARRFLVRTRQAQQQAALAPPALPPAPPPPPALPPAPPPINAAGIEVNAHGIIANAVRNRQRRLLNAVIVCLAMSHERASDRARLVNLLQTFRYVVGVSFIDLPADPKIYKELAPYVTSGRYKQISMLFKNFRETGRSPNPLIVYLQNKQHIPERIVCLDYFFLQHPYYIDQYGMNWLLEGNPKREGKAKRLLDYATDVYLGVDKSGLVKQMMKEYAAYKPKTMKCTYVQTCPLYELDQEIEEIPGRSGAVAQMRLYLDQETPFLHVNLL